MLSNGNSTLSYNNFKLMPEVPNMILTKLMTDTSTSAENLWKLLKYPTYEPLINPNLTFDEKYAMVWSPKQPNYEQENLFNVFLKPLIPSALNTAEEQLQLRIYRYINKPITTLESMLIYQFDVITQEACSLVYNENDVMCERTDLIESYLLDCLNGSDLQIGSSFFTFSAQMNNQIGSVLDINNAKSLFGRTMRLALSYVGADNGGVC